ncbi:hypothetical protein BGZ97_002522 [Linnemannia gamsii]|uniref:Uncharacterized protein n=1 Tax=Linnemannia gamsii TaxID=64522 RepID=A0A9P6QUP2_9FUNG|nr:hypothetical protein BGZ97_002522 [Linnemannia gamsii]
MRFAAIAGLFLVVAATFAEAGRQCSNGAPGCNACVCNQWADTQSCCGNGAFNDGNGNCEGLKTSSVESFKSCCRDIRGFGRCCCSQVSASNILQSYNRQMVSKQKGKLMMFQTPHHILKMPQSVIMKTSSSIEEDITEQQAAALASLSQQVLWMVDGVDLLSKFNNFKYKQSQSRHSLALDDIADVNSEDSFNLRQRHVRTLTWVKEGNASGACPGLDKTFSLY